jgi:hypothetical protein
MPNSKKFPRKSDLFRSRFLAAGKDAAVIRDVRRLREYLAGQVILAGLQGGFLVALALFARTVWHLFARHGEALNPMFARISLLGFLVCFLLIGRGLLLRLREIRAVRIDLAEANERLLELREELLRGDLEQRSVAPPGGRPSYPRKDHE